MIVKPWDAGQQCWLDLMTTDLESAKSFYSALLGWSFTEDPMPGDAPGVYTVATLDGGRVGGVNEIGPKQREMGMPPAWFVYTTVESVDATAAATKDHGGGVVTEPFDIPDTGRMAILSGPGGEVFSVWEQASKHPGSAHFDSAPGSFCWGELGTHDPDTAKAFYGEVFPWQGDTQKMGETDYTTFMAGEAPAAGMYKMPPEMARVPAHWLAYFAVADIEGSTEKAKSLGAEQICPATKAEGVGTFSILRDPQGVNFAIIQLDPQ